MVTNSSTYISKYHSNRLITITYMTPFSGRTEKTPECGFSRINRNVYWLSRKYIFYKNVVYILLKYWYCFKLHFCRRDFFDSTNGLRFILEKRYLAAFSPVRHQATAWPEWQLEMLAGELAKFYWKTIFLSNLQFLLVS